MALGLTATAVPKSKKNPTGRALDMPGQALAITALGALSLAVIEGPRWGWEWIRQRHGVRRFGTRRGAVRAAATRRGRRARAAGVFACDRVFSASLGIAAAMTFGMYAMLFLTPLYLQAARGDSALRAGVELLPMSVAFVIVSQLSGKIANAYGPRLPMTLGMALMGTGLFMLALIPFDNSLLLVEAALLVIGCGLGLNTAPVNGVAVANVPAARSGTASGLVNTARMVGATLGVAVLGAIFTVVAGRNPDAGRVIAGLPPAFVVGGIGEMIGAAAAFIFIRRSSLYPAKR